MHSEAYGDCVTDHVSKCQGKRGKSVRIEEVEEFDTRDRSEHAKTTSSDRG